MPNPRQGKLFSVLCPVFLHKRRLFFAVFFIFLAAFATVLLPLGVRWVLDHGSTAGPQTGMEGYIFFFLGVVALLALGSAGRYYQVTWLGERLVHDLRARIFSHLLTLDQGFYTEVETGDILSRLGADLTQIKGLFGSTLALTLRNGLLSIGACVMMVAASVKLSVFVLMAIPVILAPLVGFGKRIRKLARISQDCLGNTTTFVHESLLNIDVIQATAQETRINARAHLGEEQVFEASTRYMLARAGLTAAVILLAGSALLSIVWLGVRDVATGEMSAGALGQFILASALAAGALAGLSDVWGEFHLASGAADRLWELLNRAPHITSPPGRAPSSVPQGEIRFSNVHFSYPSRPDTEVLKDFSLTLSPHETVAFVGPSGSGKTTLFKILLRFYDPSSGGITLDGQNIKTLSLDGLRRHMAWVPQDPKLFSLTLEENIRFANPQAPNTLFQRACDIAQLDEFVTPWPLGYQTLLGERGQTLSGGQKQRLALARAIVQDAPILLLDEATSALDAHNEHIIQRALSAVMESKTTLIIAHRMASVRKANRIVVLDQGRIMKIGTHETLLREEGLYKTFVDLQS